MGLFDGTGLFGRRDREPRWAGIGRGKIQEQTTQTNEPVYADPFQQYSQHVSGLLGQLGQTDGTGTIGGGMNQSTGGLMAGAPEYFANEIAGGGFPAQNEHSQFLMNQALDDYTNQMKLLGEQYGRQGSEWWFDTTGRGVGNLMAQYQLPLHQQALQRQWDSAAIMPQMAFAQEQLPYAGIGAIGGLLNPLTGFQDVSQQTIGANRPVKDLVLPIIGAAASFV